MKKLIIMLGAVAMAVCAQAAQFNWEFDADGAYAGNSTYYVFAGADTLGSTIAALLSTPNTDGVSAFNNALSSYNYQTGTLSANGLAMGELSNVGASDYATIFIFENGVVGDKAFSYLTYDASGSVYTPPAANPGSVGMYGSDFGSNEYASAWGNGTIATTASVPEPTSGLLMLVGLAGLALRRRRA